MTEQVWELVNNTSKSQTQPSAPTLEEIPDSGIEMSNNCNADNVCIPEPVTENVGTSEPVNPEADTNVNVGASMAAGGVAGLLLGGPFVSVLGAVGGAVYATKEGAAGDIARAGGEIAISVRDRAIVLNNKHDLVSKAKQAACAAGAKIRDICQRHQVLDKTRALLAVIIDKIKEFERENNVLETIFKGISIASQNLAEQVRRAGNNRSERSDASTSVPSAPVGKTTDSV